MVATNAFPSATTAGAGLFSGASSTGLVQGTAHPDPSTRFRLHGGVLSNNETIPMWGGVGVYALIPPISTSGPLQPLGPSLGRATGLALSGSFPLAGFSTFDQAFNQVNSPASPVQTAGSGQMVNYYPLGSLARIAVACDPALISLRNGPDNASNLVSWDFVDQMLVPYSPAYAQVTITGAVWANTAGGQTTFTVGTDLTSVLVAGDDITVFGVVSTGGTGAGFNGEWTVVSVTDSSHVVVTQAAASSPGTYASGGHIAAAGGALSVTILDVQPTNCMTVSFNTTTGNASWNYNGACAVIQI